MAHRERMLWGVVAVLGLGRPAEAQEDPGTSYSVFLRAGAGHYVGGLGVIDSVGPSWGLTFDLRAASFLGIELSYEGSTNYFYDGEGYDAFLTRSEISALAKLSLPTSGAVRPFVAAGVGESVFVGKNVSITWASDLPLGAGVEWRSGRLLAGARVTYRWLFGRARERNDLAAYLDATAMVGLNF